MTPSSWTTARPNPSGSNRPGEAIGGELEGSRLTALSAPLISWKRFTDENPSGVVLQRVRGTDAGADQALRTRYDMAPYENYIEGDAFGLYGMRGEGDRRIWDRDDLDAKTLVLGIEHGDEALGYPKSHVEAAGGVVTDSIGGLDVVVFAIDDVIHAFENPGVEFEVANDTIHADGSTWDPVSGKGGDGRRLERVTARRLFAFAWQDAHGADAFYPQVTQRRRDPEPVDGCLVWFHFSGRLHPPSQ